MALDITRWIGPLALFVDEGPMGDGHAYRGARPPDATPLFVVVDAAGDAHEHAWRRHGAEVGALPRVVLRVGRTTAFELVPGVTLLDVQALTRESGAELPLEVALYVTVHVAQALERLHDVGSRPGPIDASCIRVGFEGRVVLFTSPWVATASGGVFDVSPLSGGAPPGSAPFEAGWAPEELAGAPVDPRRADVFRLGCLLHCLLDGVHPFDADTPLGALERAHRGSPEPLQRSVSDALARELSRALRRDSAERHAGPLMFAKALRRAVDVDMQSARAATGGIARGLFPLAVEEQRLFLEELGAADLDLTVPDSAAALVFDGRHVVVALRGEPRLFVDRHVVTFGELRAYLEATGAPPPPSFAELAHEPLTMIAPADIAGFAAWRGGRLPTEEEWVRGARCGSLADLTRVWEWTSTPVNDGFRVRGGPWRDRQEPGRLDNRSWENVAAQDLGFRLVYDGPVPGARTVNANRVT